VLAEPPQAAAGEAVEATQITREEARRMVV
jgi:hypothetical protein